ncbi:MAG: hypothetical protein HWE12_03845 [Oceanospirillaceae bacterium]|nr:hypothetical protein [Oceanospirillaceae bacterium]
MIISRSFLFFLASIFISGSVAHADPLRISVYSYHEMPPFWNDQSGGATQKLVDILNDNAEGNFEFVLVMTPRTRLNSILKPWTSGHCPAKDCDHNWVLPWVSPTWGFLPPNSQPYQIIPQFEDRNHVISLAGGKFTFTGLENLKGTRFIGIRGHRYAGVDGYVDSGDVERINANTDKEVLMMLLHGKADFAILPQSGFVYYTADADSITGANKDRYVVAETSHQVYMRNILAPSSNPALVEFLKRGAVQSALVQLHRSMTIN